MNMFINYDGVIVGLNYWPKLMILSMTVMIFVGWKQFKLSKTGNIRRFYNERFFGIIAGMFAVAIAVAVFVECAEGIIKYFDLHCLTTYDSSIWSLILMVQAIMFLAFLWFSAIYLIGVTIGKIRRDSLIAHRYNLH